MYNTLPDSFDFEAYLKQTETKNHKMRKPSDYLDETIERMFGDIGSAEERAARFRSKASILDSVIDAANRLNGKLAPQDRSTVGEYLENIREVESRIQIGWVIVGGMSFGTIFTLFLVPAVYTYLTRRNHSVQG